MGQKDHIRPRNEEERIAADEARDLEIPRLEEVLQNYINSHRFLATAPVKMGLKLARLQHFLFGRRGMFQLH
jgi:hypothetical protein